MAASRTYLQLLFGQHIKQLRIEQGLTQVELSSRMSKDQQSLQRIESGNVSPNLFYLYNLSTALNISLNELLNFEVKRERKKDSRNKK